MTPNRREAALRIKEELDALAATARAAGLGEVLHFIEVAALAAQEAADPPVANPRTIRSLRPVGRC